MLQGINKDFTVTQLKKVLEKFSLPYDCSSRDFEHNGTCPIELSGINTRATAFTYLVLFKITYGLMSRRKCFLNRD